MALLPRLVLIGFKFSQPLLISRVTSILSQGNADEATGKALIGAAVLIYLGLAISNAWYSYQLNRAATMARGILVTAVFEKVLLIDFNAIDGKAVVTLSTRDVTSGTANAKRAFEGLLASPFEIIVAFVLLAREVGWTCIFAVILSVAATAWGFWNGSAAAPMVRAWVQASQERVSLTSEILGATKTFKMLGLTEALTSMIQKARVSELEQSKPFRLFITYRNAIGKLNRLWSSQELTL